MRKLFACAALAAMCATTPTLAQTVSGKYIVTIHNLCQPAMGFDFGDDNGGIGIFAKNVTLAEGFFANDLYLMDFNSAKGTVTTSGFKDAGDVIIVQESGAQTVQLGGPYTESSASGKMSYANTSATITFGNQTFKALFGQVDKNGIAHYFAFQGIGPSGGGPGTCGNQGTASRQ